MAVVKVKKLEHVREFMHYSRSFKDMTHFKGKHFASSDSFIHVYSNRRLNSLFCDGIRKSWGCWPQRYNLENFTFL